MKIKQLTIKNFRSFKEESKFDFDTYGEKNIILIGGENGSGKSSIFEAIKLCIYGPLTYRYQGMVPNYIAKIKSAINEDVYSKDSINSFVELKILFNVSGEENLYTIRRTWDLIKGKLREEFIIKKDGRVLRENESEEFESFLKDLIPPNVFDLFFFDGEKLSEFFSDKKGNLKLKDTILTLNNLDIFNILSRELYLNTRRKDREKENLSELVIELERYEEKVNSLNKELQLLENAIYFGMNKKEELKIDIESAKREFISAGGLRDKEKDKLTNKISLAENNRDLVNQKLKEYCNDILPFIMIKDMLLDIKRQLYLEGEYIIYDSIKDKIDNDKISKVVSNVIPSNEINDSQLNKIVLGIRKLVISNEFEEDFSQIHNLSKEQQINVISYIDKILNEDIRTANFFDTIDSITGDIAKNRNKLRQSLGEEEEKEYISKIDQLNKDLNDIEIKLTEDKEKREKINLEREVTQKLLNKTDEKIVLLKRLDGVNYISNNIMEMIDELLKNITIKKKEDVEDNFQFIFSQIIRKEKFIDFIRLDEDFKSNLYVKKDYSNKDIVTLILNLGLEGLEKKFGKLFIEELYFLSNSKDKKDILTYFNKKNRDQSTKINTKIDIMNLSSGEKQVYLLCLYWAIIKSSGVEIPFIIDTPYGRIDEKHRKSITTKFFPKISNQVIILSTNTEIEEGLYEDINKYISKEYMLNYDSVERKTIINQGYFYEVI